MTLYNLIKQYTNGSEESMWKSVKTISDFLEDKLSNEDKDCLNRCIYGIISEGHYNEKFAIEDIKKMTVSGDDGKIHSNDEWQFVDFDSSKNHFDSYHRRYNDSYNEYDYWVATNMVYTDNIEMLLKWFPNSQNNGIMDKVYEMTDNWLNDKDNPFGDAKIWKYFNSKP